jgi:hypothetical protein
VFFYSVPSALLVCFLVFGFAVDKTERFSGINLPISGKYTFASKQAKQTW